MRPFERDRTRKFALCFRQSGSYRVAADAGRVARGAGDDAPVCGRGPLRRLVVVAGLLAALVTPNLHEAEVLTGFSVLTPSDQEKAAQAIYNGVKEWMDKRGAKP